MCQNFISPSPTVFDTVTFIIAVLAFALSVLQWIFTLYKERFHISVTCTGYSIHTSTEIKDYQHNTFGFIVNNHSSLPISVNIIRVRTVSNGYKNFDLTHRFMKEHLFPLGTDTYQFFTTDFPVKIDAYSSSLIYATFETKDKDEHIFFSDNSECYFEFVTNRKVKSATLVCKEINFLKQ